jgi:hypothetical protein
LLKKQKRKIKRQAEARERDEKLQKGIKVSEGVYIIMIKSL